MPPRRRWRRLAAGRAAPQSPPAAALLPCAIACEKGGGQLAPRLLSCGQRVKREAGARLQAMPQRHAPPGRKACAAPATVSGNQTPTASAPLARGSHCASCPEPFRAGAGRPGPRSKPGAPSPEAARRLRRSASPDTGLPSSLSVGGCGRAAGRPRPMHLPCRKARAVCRAAVSHDFRAARP